MSKIAAIKRDIKKSGVKAGTPEIKSIAVVKGIVRSNKKPSKNIGFNVLSSFFVINIAIEVQIAKKRE